MKKVLEDKICPTCKTPFYPKGSHRKYCSLECYRKTLLQYHWAETKKCSKCKLIKERSEFTPSKRTHSGLLYWCKECYRNRNREVYKFECVDCGAKCKRIKRYSTEKEDVRSNRCNKCAKNKILMDNGGVPVNYSGTKTFAGRTFSTWVASAKRRHIEWELTKEQLELKFEEQKGICVISGIKMEPKSNSLFRPSIDRIDSLRGYIVGNFQFVCSMVNMMKNKYEQNEFIRMCKKIAEFDNRNEKELINKDEN